ncbi:hypothetical protein Droror1_Dr00007090 [Drosera rotundifolia]
MSLPLLLFISLFITIANAATFHFTNLCPDTIYPALLAGATSPPPPTTGFPLPSSHSLSLPIPSSFSGRLWARTHCTLNSSTFTCLTGDCGSGTVPCSGGGAKPPATLAEFTLNGSQSLDFYDLSLVDGFNLPILVAPMGWGRGGDCSATGCLVDVNRVCPTGLSVRGGEVEGVVACRSACDAFGDPRFCCSGEFDTPETCPANEYSRVFKQACPRAYSYAYDDKTSTFTCRGADYLIMFCPPPYSSEILLGARRMAGELPLVNKSMMHLHPSGGSFEAPVAAILQLILCLTTALSAFLGV